MMSLQKNYLQKYQKVNQQSSQWSAIQYKLQLNLGNASACLKQVYSVVNPYNNTHFENDNKGYIIYDAFVKMDKNQKSDQQFSGANRIQRVCQKGFQFPVAQTGLQFTVGQIDINPNEKQKSQKGEKSVFELLVVKLCPRKSYPSYQKDLNKTMQKCPTGFQSIYYNDKNEERGLYRHRFRLYKKNQVLPYYVIQFEFSKQHENKFKDIICQQCRDETAISFCTTQKVYFCQKCDYQHHKDKISARHQRSKLQNNPILDFGDCKNHNNAHYLSKNQLFCQICNASMCMQCKIKGQHSNGYLATHQLHKISDYYIDASKKLQIKQPKLDARKYQLRELLQYLDNQIQLINKKTSLLQTDLKNQFQKVLSKLESISKQKLSYLMSEQLEVKRQYDFIEWMESFIKYQKQMLPPNNFLIAWTKHEKLRRQVLNISNIPMITQIKANMKIVGKIDVQQAQLINSGGGEQKSDDLYNPKQINKHLQKYLKSTGGKGPLPGQRNRDMSELRRRIMFDNKQV